LPLLMWALLAALAVPAPSNDAESALSTSFDAEFARAFPEGSRPERFTASSKLWETFMQAGHLQPMLAAAASRGPDARPLLCDIGAADGSLTSYISSAFGMAPAAYDIVAPTENLYSVVAEQTQVTMFDGKTIPQADGACDLTLFCYVLHHAANNTFSLLQEAVRASRPGSGMVMIAEDLADPTNARRTARNLEHDWHGIFRTDDEWRALIFAMGLEIVHSGPLFAADSPQVFYIARPRR